MTTTEQGESQAWASTVLVQSESSLGQSGGLCGLGA